MRKLSRQLKIRILILILFLPGLISIALLPDSIEGVYNPLDISSTMGCACDQFLEFREGRVVYHVIDSPDSMLNLYYEKDATGAILIKLPSDKFGE